MKVDKPSPHKYFFLQKTNIELEHFKKTKTLRRKLIAQNETLELQKLASNPNFQLFKGQQLPFFFSFLNEIIILHYTNSLQTSQRTAT